MYLKNRNKSPEPGFVFYYEDPVTKKEVRVPETRQANGLNALAALVRASFANNGIPIDPNLIKIIEHQICLRHKDPKSACYSGGLGDDIHLNLSKPLLRSIEMVAKGVHANGVARMAKKLSGCSSCGGTKTYKKGVNNLGRAGTLNKLG